MTKDEWRSEYKKRRDQLEPDYCGPALKSIQTNLDKLTKDLQLPKEFKVGYRSFRSEVDLDSYFFANSTNKWAFPRVSDNDLIFYRAQKNSEFEKGAYGLWEPNDSLCPPVALDDCGLVLIPGVAFDRMGRRLGYGKGFYDRALENFAGVKVGVAYSVQITDDYLPTENHDVLMDYIVTENFIMTSLHKKED